MGHWRSALIWGIGVALLHRFLLLVWMAGVWLSFGGITGGLQRHTDPVANLPPLTTPLDQAVIGVWRRWDASHYLNLAQNGYRPSDPGPTVFGPLTPALIALFDQLTPGSVEVAGMLFGTVAFAAALVLLYRVCEVYYGDGQLARWAVVLTAQLPLSFFFQAPMSEALYLALALAIFYAAAKKRWWLATSFGLLATLVRSQGILLMLVAGLLALEQQTDPIFWRRCQRAIKQNWPLAFIPLSLAAFLVYRSGLGLPSLTETYRTYSYIYLVNPLAGLLTNLCWIGGHLSDAVFCLDEWALLGALALSVGLIRDPRHRRWPLLAYTLGYILVFVGKLNYRRGTDEVTYTLSFARYSLTLFPLTIWSADHLRRLSRRWQIVLASLLISGLLIFSTLFALGAGSP